MNTPYENGAKHGGQIDPDDMSLEETEKLYRYEIEHLGDCGPAYPATEHAEYMAGWIAGARQAHQR